MEMYCPVTRGYLRAVRNLFDLESIQYEMYLEPIEEISEMADHAGGSRQLEHQRAFYCVELMTSRFAINNINPKWKRSREGLNNLILLANEIRDDILADITEFAFLAGVQDGQAERRNDNLRKVATMLQLVCESAELVRQSLRNPEVPLSRVGKRLALAAHSSGYYIDRMLELARELIDYSEGSARRAWEPPRM